MVTNPYLNNFFATNEQELFHKLAVEFVQFYGIDCIYLPRNVTREDKMMHEDSLATFTTAVTLEMYIKETEGFQGDGDFLSKFGLQIRDSMTLSVAVVRCKEELGENRRPMEGDLIYLPLNKKMFEVTFVEHEASFYQRGGLYYYDLKTELYEFANETFNTGNATVDTLYDAFDTSTSEAIDDLGSIDPIADNEIIQDFANGILDFTEMDPYSKDGEW